MDRAGVLLQTPIFRDLTRRDVEEIVPHLAERRYDAGQTVWVEGDPADALFVLAEGALKSHRLSREVVTSSSASTRPSTSSARWACSTRAGSVRST